MSCITVEDRVVVDDDTDKLTRASFRACDPMDIASPALRENGMYSIRHHIPVSLSPLQHMGADWTCSR